jgi:hypothetical protein
MNLFATIQGVKVRHWAMKVLDFIAIGFMGVMLYALSMGPVGFLVNKGVLPDELGIAYTPLITFSRMVLPLEFALGWYLDLWGMALGFME